MKRDEVREIRILIKCLSFTEMKMTNVAAFKPVSMSSEHNPPYHSPHYAVDGQVKNTIYGNQCAHTVNDPTPWLTIDLGNTFEVHYVTLFNRIETLGKKDIFLEVKNVL